jgi:ligand-binding sensor domain-containing protein/two-component sensor histidine kinase
MCRYLPSLLLFLIILFQANGQILPFQRYSTKEGLNNRGAYAVITDSRGLLWVGTAFGVNWFDGEKFSVVPIESKTGQLYVTRFFRDSHEDVWVLTFYNGLYRFHNNQFRNFLPDSANLESTANNIFDMVELQDKKYLVATDRGPFFFDGQNFSLVDPENIEIRSQTTSIAAMGKDEFLLANKGVHRYKKGANGWQLQETVFRNHSINRLLIHQDSLWIATDNGVLVCDLLNLNRSARHYLAGKRISDIRSTPKNDIILASDGIYVGHKNTMRLLNAVNGFTNTGVYDIYCNNRLIWFACDDGLFRLEEKNYSFERFKTASGPPVIGPIATDSQHQLWVTINNELAKKTPSGPVFAVTSDGKKISGAITFHLDKQKNFRVGTPEGLYRFRDKGAAIRESLLPVSAFFEDENQLWLGTIQGELYTMKDSHITRFFLPNNNKEFIQAIYRNKNDLWIGYRSGGIRVYTMRNDACVLSREFSTRNGFVNLRVRCFYPDNQGNLIVGTRTNGIFIFPFANPERYLHLTTQQGLSGNWVKAIAKDASGKLYLATNNGINTLQEGQYATPFIDQVQFGNDAIARETNSILFDGRAIWAGTYSGLLYYLPDTDQPEKIAPPVYLTKVTINGRADSALVAYSFDKGIRKFSYDQNVIAVEFAGIDLGGNGKLKYRYRLQGQDPDWNEGTERNFVSYHLSPGKYTFEVQASNDNVRWSATAASYSFYIAKAFWQTSWFIACCSVFILGIIYSIYRYRLQQVVKLEKLRSKISADLHDDIGSTLSSISILSDLASRERNGDASLMMTEIKTNSLQLMEKMDDIVWSINPKNDSLENLLMRIRQFAARLFEAKNIDYDIIIDEDIRHLRLPMEHRQHIYLLMKEAINNLLKYSDCSQACIHVTKNHQHLLVTIRDNGKGFAMQEYADRNGLLTMKNRASRMNALLNIDTAPAAGTCITLEVKIK